jgi:hypothetical protein
MDGDILSQGDDREPRPWPRRLGLIAIAALAVIGGIVYVALPRHQPAASAAAPTTPAVLPSGTLGTTTLRPQIVVSLGLVQPGQPGPSVERDGIIVGGLAWSDSVRLPVAGTQPAWYRPAAGRSDTIGELPADSAGYQFIRVGGGWAVQADPGAKADCVNCAGPAMPVWYLADGARSAVRVGQANQVAPAAVSGDLWLTTYPTDAEADPARGTAREIGPSGAALGPAITLPAGYQIAQGTDRGLLLTPAGPQSGVVVDRLWDPAARSAPPSAAGSASSPSRTFDQVIAANATEIAWGGGCATACRVDVLNLATGRQTVVRLPAGILASGGALSPSGSFLALQLASSDGQLALPVEVATVASGRLTRMPGSWINSNALAGFGWPSGGDSLVAEFNVASTLLLTSWHPGASALSLAVVKPGPTQASLVVG